MREYSVHELEKFRRFVNKCREEVKQRHPTDEFFCNIMDTVTDYLVGKIEIEIDRSVMEDEKWQKKRLVV